MSSLFGFLCPLRRRGEALSQRGCAASFRRCRRQRTRALIPLGDAVGVPQVKKECRAWASRRTTKLTLVYFLPGLLFVGCLCVSLLLTINANQRSRAQDLSTSITAQGVQYLDIAAGVSTNALHVALLRSVVELLSNDTAGALQNVEAEFTSWVRYWPFLKEITLVDAAGMEMVRDSAHYELGSSVVSSDFSSQATLQNLSDSECFAGVQAVERGGVYVSRMMLEDYCNGSATNSASARVVHTGSPVFANESSDAPIGYAFVTLRAERLLDAVKTAVGDYGWNLVNSDGYWLDGNGVPDNETFTWQKPEVENVSFASRYPHIWNRVLASADSADPGGEHFDGQQIVTWLQRDPCAFAGKDYTTLATCQGGSPMYLILMDNWKTLGNGNLALWTAIIWVAITFAALLWLAVSVAFVRSVVAREQLMQQEVDMADFRSKNKELWLAVMCHELRSPLNVIIGAIDLMDGPDLPPGKAPILQLMQGSAELLVSVINDVLDISKIEQGLLELDPRPFSPRQDVQSCVDIYAVAALRKGLDVYLTFGSEVPEVVIADMPRVRQVLSNILSNAVKFTSTGSITVTVDASLIPETDAALLAKIVHNRGGHGQNGSGSAGGSSGSRIGGGGGGSSGSRIGSGSATGGSGGGGSGGGSSLGHKESKISSPVAGSVGGGSAGHGSTGFNFPRPAYATYQWLLAPFARHQRGGTPPKEDLAAAAEVVADTKEQISTDEEMGVASTIPAHVGGHPPALQLHGMPRQHPPPLLPPPLQTSPHPPQVPATPSVASFRQGPPLSFSSQRVKTPVTATQTLPPPPPAAMQQQQPSPLVHFMLEIVVRDTGKGIAPSRQTKVWQPYTQEDAGSTREHGGTGLGLTIAKRLVELMGGSISLESALNRGTTFTLRIPVHLEVGGAADERRLAPLSTLTQDDAAAAPSFAVGGGSGSSVSGSRNGGGGGGGNVAGPGVIGSRTGSGFSVESSNGTTSGGESGIAEFLVGHARDGSGGLTRGLARPPGIIEEGSTSQDSSTNAQEGSPPQQQDQEGQIIVEGKPEQELKYPLVIGSSSESCEVHVAALREGVGLADGRVVLYLAHARLVRALLADALGLPGGEKINVVVIDSQCVKDDLPHMVGVLRGALPGLGLLVLLGSRWAHLLGDAALRGCHVMHMPITPAKIRDALESLRLRSRPSLPSSENGGGGSHPSFPSFGGSMSDIAAGASSTVANTAAPSASLQRPRTSSTGLDSLSYVRQSPGPPLLEDAVTTAAFEKKAAAAAEAVAALGGSASRLSGSGADAAVAQSGGGGAGGSRAGSEGCASGGVSGLSGIENELRLDTGSGAGSNGSGPDSMDDSGGAVRRRRRRLRLFARDPPSSSETDRPPSYSDSRSPKAPTPGVFGFAQVAAAAGAAEAEVGIGGNGGDEAAAAAAVRRKGALRSLVVDDTSANRRILEHMLQMMGHECALAENGVEAVAMEAAADPPFDYIFMDLHMPLMDGVDATLQIKAKYAEAAVAAVSAPAGTKLRRRKPPLVIMVTASVLAPDRERCERAGADGYMPKPIRRSDLTDLLDKLGWKTTP